MINMLMIGTMHKQLALGLTFIGILGTRIKTKSAIQVEHLCVANKGCEKVLN